MTDFVFILDYVGSIGVDLGPGAPADGRIVHHPSSNDEYEHSPLIVVVDGGECRVTVAHFSDGDLVPGMSITFGPTGKPVLATDSFGKESATDTVAATLAQGIRAVYSRSGDVEVL